MSEVLLAVVTLVDASFILVYKKKFTKEDIMIIIPCVVFMSDRIYFYTKGLKGLPIKGVYTEYSMTYVIHFPW